MRIKRLITILLIFLFILIAFILIRPAFNRLSGFLSTTERVNANILVVEGWIPFQALDYVASEIRINKYEYIITTGLRSTPEYYNISMDGYLIFYPKGRLDEFTEPDTHIIAVTAISELEGEHSAHFNFWINETIEADFFADTKKRKYAISWKGSLSEIDSVMIHFDNDKMGDFGDRNLFVKEIIINNDIIIPFLNFSVYDIGDLDGKERIINNLTSNADLTRKRLTAIGIDSSLIIAVPGNKVLINRTLTSAVAFRDWLNKSEIKVKGINIISTGTHSRRTWMTFRKVLDKTFDIGIISLPDKKNNNSTKRRFLKTLRETAAIMYYWIILLPY
jgi:hypothetical protein